MILKKGFFENRVYNVVTINTSVHEIVDIISGSVPGISIQYVDTEIMNQLSFHVDSKRFQDAGFECLGDLTRGIRETLALLKGASSWRAGEIG